MRHRLYTTRPDLRRAQDQARLAKLLGWADQIGALKPGYFADVIAVPGDPLKDIEVLTKAPFVMRGSGSNPGWRLASLKEASAAISSVSTSTSLRRPTVRVL